MKRLILILLLICPMLLYARSYLDVSGRIGLGGLLYDCDYGGMSPGYHAALDVGYLYKSPFWIAVRAGVSIEAASSTYSRVDYQDRYTTIDVENQEMQVLYNIGRLREQHQAYKVSFPVQVGFHIDKFTFLVGPRISVPLSASWKETATDASLAVYYPVLDNLVEESFPLAASKSFEMENKGELNLPKWQCAISSELTYGFRISSDYSKMESYITVGVYFDMGLVYTGTNPNQNMYGVLQLTDTRDGLPLSRIMTPVLEAWWENKPLVAGFRSFDVGFKVAYRLTSLPTVRQPRKHGCHCYE